MLELNLDKLQTIVGNDFLEGHRLRWHYDNEGKLLNIKIHTKYSALYIFWADLMETKYMILFNARKQRIYIKDITYKQENSDLIAETLKNMIDIVFSTYRTCIKLSDDFERVDK